MLEFSVHPLSNNGFPFTGCAYHLVVARNYEMLNPAMHIITPYIYNALIMTRWGSTIALSHYTPFLSCETSSVATGGKQTCLLRKP